MAYNAKDEVQTIITDITKSDRELIRITTVANKSGDSVDVRLLLKNGENEPIYTAKGFRVRSGLVPDIIEGLQQAMKRIEETTDETDET